MFTSQVNGLKTASYADSWPNSLKKTLIRTDLAVFTLY